MSVFQAKSTDKSAKQKAFPLMTISYHMAKYVTFDVRFNWSEIIASTICIMIYVYQ